MKDIISPFQYPEEVKPLFLETEDLVFEDGTCITTEQMWDFMTKEGPARYPYAFNMQASFGGQLSGDVTFLSGIKQNYLSLTHMDRIRSMHDKGKPIVIVRGWITSEPYYAAGCISVGPPFPRGWMLQQLTGQNFRQINLKGMSLLEEARQNLSIESCNLVAYLALLKKNSLPVSAIAPCICTGCSDMAYAAAACRTSPIKVPTFFMDYPVNHGCEEGRVDYLEMEIRSITEKLGALSGKTVTDEILGAEIKRENQARRIVRECQKIWWNAEVPPTNSIDNSFVHLGSMGAFDYIVAIQVLQEYMGEIRDRVQKGVTGYGISSDPARLFICGSCVHPNPAFIDKKGGIIVGKDDQWSAMTMDVKESGDPYENLARAISSHPYERPTEERAEWTVEQVRDSRADGVIFMYNWGCNYQSAVAGMITDIIKERTGLPAICIELGELTRMESLEQSQNRVEAFIEMLR
jgi:benzoyl-CoA reductase/2-hydroxyglutaryl-CoA dehydratase subunit BcrC/BadD/HgdB